MTETHYWIIEPIAAADDSRWLDTRRWQRIVAMAPTAAQARLAAERMDARLAKPDHTVEQYAPGKGLADPKLYGVRPMSAGEAKAIADQPDDLGILAADLAEEQPSGLD